MLAETSGSWGASVALVVAALAAAYATIITARKGGQSTPPPPAPPPPATHADSDDELVARMWVEMLTRADATAAERDEWKKRFDACDLERLDLLRRLARGDTP